MRYIERNPVRVGEAVIPEQYPWSSAKVGIRGRPESADENRQEVENERVLYERHSQPS
jgi:hypothetical protein